MIKAHMIYNNIGVETLLVQKWGLSILINNQNENLLFDTGGDPDALLQNMRSKGIDISSITDIVISHNHWDHISGLPMILEETGCKPSVYVPDLELEKLKSKFPAARFVGVKQAMKINNYVWSTGSLQGIHRGNLISEQAIILKKEDGVYLFTGCSHPGIVRMVEQTQIIFPELPIKLVAGGFHLNDHSEDQILNISNRLKQLHVGKIAPSHCSGDNALKIFQDEWRDNYVTFDLSSNELNI